jgi:DNA-binding MurR/RpiR family transcriptional regulator
MTAMTAMRISASRFVRRSGPGGLNFPDRARRSQEIGHQGEPGGLFADMVGAAIRNIEDSFAAISADQVQATAEAISSSRNVHALGVGVNNSNARNFTYLASTGMLIFLAIPRPGSVAVDDLAWADVGDVLIAITGAPHRSELVEAVRIARDQGMTVIGISDSPASPVIIGAAHGFVLAAETPRFFSIFDFDHRAAETLQSFVIAEASPEIVDRVARFHTRHHQLGIYEEERP